MSRRAFIRWMLGLFAMIGVMLTGLFKLLQQSIESQRQAKEVAAAVDPHQPAAGTNIVQASAEPDRPLNSFMLLSDLHITPYDPNTQSNLRKALDDLVRFEPPVDALVFTGDLTEYGTERDYKELRSILSAYQLPPVYANMGNHDYYDIWIDRKGAFNKDTMPNGKTDWQSRERFTQFFGLEKPFHDVWIGDSHIILLSQEAYVQEKPEVGEGAWYSDEQLSWFAAKLKQHEGSGKPVFVMTHQPLPPAGTDGKTHQLIRAKEFRELLKPYPNVFVFCGHRHQDFVGTFDHYVKETFHYFHNSSVGRVMNRQFRSVDKNRSQGLFVQVYRDKVTVRGRDFAIGAWLPEADWTIPLKNV